MIALPPDDKDKLFDMLLKYYKLNETVMSFDLGSEDGEGFASVVFDEMEEVVNKINITLGLKKREIIQTELKFE